MSLKELLGEKVLKTGDLSDVEVSSFGKEGSVVGLYFSAHWCPPCRAFTPKLAEWYNKFKKGPKADNFEIVFISSDKDDEQWKQYFSEMPWYAMPYKERERKAMLSKKFKVTGIPTLIFVDGSTGVIITADGRSIVSEDPDGAEFPWRPKPLSEVFKELKVINKQKEELSMDTLEGKIVGLYFSAHWCGPCRVFTPQLIKTYDKLKEDGKPFEIIFVSSDRDEESWSEYYDSMPWLSLSFDDKNKKVLSKTFDISGIPSFVLLNENREVITKSGRGEVSSDPEGKDFPWYPKPVNVLSENTASDINDTATLIWFVEDAEIDKAKEILQPIAEEYIKKWSETKVEPELLFMVSSEGDGNTEIRDSLKHFAKLPNTTPLLSIIDIPQQSVYESEKSEVNEGNVQAMVSDYLSKKLKPRPLTG